MALARSWSAGYSVVAVGVGAGVGDADGPCDGVAVHAASSVGSARVSAAPRMAFLFSNIGFSFTYQK